MRRHDEKWLLVAHYYAEIMACHSLFGALLLSTALTVGLVGCASNVTAQPTPTADANSISTVEFEWIATSAAGQIDGTPDSFTLTMTSVNPDVIQYAERPARFYDTITLEELVTSPGLWLESDPPNAVLTFHTGDTSVAPDVLPVVLSKAAWDAATGVLSFHGKVLSDRETLPSNIVSVTAAIDGTVTQNTQLSQGVTVNSVMTTTSATISFQDSNFMTCKVVNLTPGTMNRFVIQSSTSGDCDLNGTVYVLPSSPTAYTVKYVGTVADGRGGTTSGTYLVGTLN